MLNRESSVATLDEPSQTQNAIESEREHYPISSEGDIEPQPTAIFQAVGIVTGAVHLDLETHRNTVTINGSTYSLFYISQKRQAFEALKAEIAATGNSRQRLIVVLSN